MPKRFLLPFVPGLFVLVTGVGGTIAGPAGRTQGYFAIQRQWEAHWPLQNGKKLPRLFEPMVQPFAPVWLQVEPGIKMRLDPYDYVSREILETGKWEPESWAVIQDHLGKGATLIDVGAHIGYYSLKAAPVVGPGGRVIAVEPNPETIAKLNGNIQASGANMVTVEPVACSDAEATLELFAAPRSNTGETSLSRANASQDSQGVISYKVRARPLDAVLREAGVSRVDAIKIDVEGAEYLVLKGATETLDRYHPAILIELVEHQLQAMGASSQQVIELLRSHGYTARRSIEHNVEFVADAGAGKAEEHAKIGQ
jgi:FkbM family methyltransferase